GVGVVAKGWDPSQTGPQVSQEAPQVSQATSQVSQTKDDSYIFQQLTSETPNWAAYLASNRFKAVVRIISIEREYGCGAAKIAQKLAEHLGWDLWDQRLTQEIARLAQSTESAIEQRESVATRSII